MKATIAALYTLSAWSAASVLPVSAGAQLSGTVRDSASRQPLAGAVVSLLDGLNAVIGRELTNARGQFSAALPSGARRLRVVHIGFRPRELDIPQPASGVVHVDIDMTQLTTMLEPVAIRANSTCPRRADRADAFALFEQARAGLLTIAVAREADPAALVRYGFVRTMDGTSDRIARQSVRVDSTDASAASFHVAHAAVDFVRRGFMRDSAGTNVFYAPDAEVLLDDAFVSAYCFHLVRDESSRPHQLGLSFAPASGRDGRVDVDGTLWIDTLVRAVRDIDFHYTALPSAIMRYRPGGTVSYREVVPGIVLVDRWTLRLVGVLEDTTHYTVSNGADDMVVRRSLYVRETGGTLARARWADGRSWQMPLGALRVRATTSDGTPAAGTLVKLVGAAYRKGITPADAETPYRATTDSSGRVEIRDLIPGPYSIVIVDPRLASIRFDLPTSFSFTAANDSMVTGTLNVQTTEEFVFSRCLEHGRFGRADSALVFGRVTSASDVPLNGIVLSTSWRVNGGLDSWKSAGTYKGTGSDGLFLMCQRALGDTVVVRAAFDGAALAEAGRRVTGNLTIVRVVVSPRS